MFRLVPPRFSVPLLAYRAIFGLCAVLIFVVQTKAQVAAGAKEGGKQPAIRSVEKELSEGVEAFFAADFGDTDVKITENGKKAFEDLAKKFDGREIKLAFPIENISESSFGKRDLYALRMAAPSFPSSPK